MGMALATPLMASQRHGEFLRKLGAALEELFGDELERMVELTSIATAPERQGRGYASALVHIVTDLVSPVQVLFLKILLNARGMC